MAFWREEEGGLAKSSRQKERSHQVGRGFASQPRVGQSFYQRAHQLWVERSMSHSICWRREKERNKERCWREEVKRRNAIINQNNIQQII